MKQYLDLLANVYNNGVKKSDRTGTGTLSVFGATMRFDLAEGFPILTTKRVNFHAVVCELLWMLNGHTNKHILNMHGVHIWDKWADIDGDLGPIYGKQWRTWKKPDGSTVDQISAVIANLRKNPHSRRHIVSAWNVADLPDESMSPQQNVWDGKMALAPCHVLFQFYVSDNKLSCLVYQRSADIFLGVPFNIASYALLTSLVAEQCVFDVGELVWMGGDVHLYSNHVPQAEIQLSRDPQHLPKLEINGHTKSVFAYQIHDISLSCYQPAPAIAADISV